jgi:DNA-binding NtrC family response regulator
MPSVLIVDDEKNVLTTLSISLRRRDFLVRQAQSGPDALQMLEESPVDFVVSDIRMAPMNGYLLASTIRNRYPDVGIVLMSAYGSDDKTWEAENAAFPRLTKPFSVDDLVKVLHEQGARKARGVPADRGGRLVLLGEGKAVERLAARLAGLGFDCETVPRDKAEKADFQWDSYDGVVIDDAVLGDDGWSVLNAVDQAAPGLPMLVISAAGTSEGLRIERDNSFAVIRQSYLYSEGDEAGRFIRSQLRPR